MTETMSEQIAKIRPAIMQNRPEVRTVVQVTANLCGDDPKVSFDQARQQILNWLQTDQKISAIPRAAWDGDAFEIDSTEGRPVSVETLDQFWGMRYENPDSEVPGRTWRTEAILAYTDKLSIAGIRLTVISQDWDLPFYKSVPRVVRKLAESPGLKEYDTRLSESPIEVSSDSDVDRLIRLLEEPGRVRPVFVVSQNGQGGFSVDPSLLAIRTAGIAHVIVLSSQAAWSLSDRLGNGLAVYGGSLRTYNTGFDRYTSRFREHPLATPEWISRRYDDPNGLISLLARHAVDVSSNIPDLEERLPSFARFRRIVSQHRVEKAKAADSSQGELARLFEADNKNLRDELETAMQMAQESEDRAAIYRAKKQELETVVYGLRLRVEGLQSALSAAGKEEEIEIPDTLAEVDEWASRYLGDRVHLLGRAIRGARKSDYENVESVYKSLLLLGNVYWRNRCGQASKEEVRGACRDLGVDISSTGDKSTLMQWRDQYEVMWNEERRFLDMHLKKGTTHDPRLSLRIYFFWDDELQQMVVGHMTDHLKSSRS